MRDQLEVSVKALRGQLADVLNDTAVYGQITYITSRGRRIAALVPVPVADQVVSTAEGKAALA